MGDFFSRVNASVELDEGVFLSASLVVVGLGAQIAAAPIDYLGVFVRR